MWKSLLEVKKKVGCKRAFSLTGFGVAGVAGLDAGVRFTLFVSLNRCKRASLLLISSGDGVGEFEAENDRLLIRLVREFL